VIVVAFGQALDGAPRTECDEHGQTCEKLHAPGECKPPAAAKSLIRRGLFET
jgi:hypothetical protein